MAQGRNAGFAMLDVLVAVLLLAVALTGACATLVQTMRATHGALLTTRAVDLAADLTEDLQGVTSAAQAGAVLAAWQERIATVLPVAGLAPDEVTSLIPTPAALDGASAFPTDAYELTLRWQDGARGTMRELVLPVSIPGA